MERHLDDDAEVDATTIAKLISEMPDADIPKRLMMFTRIERRQILAELSRLGVTVSGMSAVSRKST